MDYADFTRTFTQGDTHIFDVQIYEAISNTVVDISLWQNFWLTAKSLVSDIDPGVFQLTIGSGLSIFNAPLGEISVIIPGSATSGLEHRRLPLLADIQGKDDIGRIWTLMRGQFIILPEITRSIV
jgi:hypothetical protein